MKQLKCTYIIIMKINLQRIIHKIFEKNIKQTFKE